MEKEDRNAIIGIVAVILSFILFAFLIQEYNSAIQNYFNLGYFGMFVFFLLVVASDVFIIVSAIPLFPLAASLWGVTITGIIGAIGWTIGGSIAFILSRKYGVNLVAKFIPIKQIYRFEKRIPERHLFLLVMASRMIFPADGVSYLVGLFTKMDFKSFALASFIGFIPFSFALAYLGEIKWQTLITLFAALVLIVIIIEIVIKIKNKIKNKRLWKMGLAD